MTLTQLTDLFLWMTIINMGIYIFSILLSILFRKTISRVHGKLFGIGDDKIATITYGYFGIYKIAIILFCFVPFLSMLLLNS